MTSPIPVEHFVHVTTPSSPCPRTLTPCPRAIPKRHAVNCGNDRNSPTCSHSPPSSNVDASTLQLSFTHFVIQECPVVRARVLVAAGSDVRKAAVVEPDAISGKYPFYAKNASHPSEVAYVKCVGNIVVILKQALCTYSIVTDKVCDKYELKAQLYPVY